MRRRRYLGLLLATAGLAGCGQVADENGETTTSATTDTTVEDPTDTQPQQTTTQTATRATQTQTQTQTTETETQTETETPTPATFEVVGVNAPDRVNVSEPNQFSLEVRNSGGQPGTFNSTIQVSVEGGGEWEDVGNIVIEDIPPNSTQTWVSNNTTFDQPYQLQFRLPDHDTQFGFDVVLPEPEISFGDSRLVEVDFGYEVRPLAEIAVTNEGQLPTKACEITIDWFDDSDEYLASTATRIETLGAGETWVARADPNIDVEDYEAIADFEANLGQVESTTTLDPEGVSVSGDEMVASEDQVLVRGSVTNERETSLDYVEVITKVYNADGEVIGSEWTNETDIASGSQVRFELEPDTQGRNGAVESYEVALSDDVL